jgi:hypothetical protein
VKVDIEICVIGWKKKYYQANVYGSNEEYLSLKVPLQVDGIFHYIHKRSKKSIFWNGYKSN